MLSSAVTSVPLMGVTALPFGIEIHLLWHNVRQTAARENVLSVTVVFVVLALLLARYVPTERKRLTTALWLFGWALFFLVLSGLLQTLELGAGAQIMHWTALLIGAIALVNLGSIFFFDILVSLLHLPTPRILRDLVVALSYIGVCMALMAREGVSLSGIITTSAVLTAVIGFSLQDTLGNIMGGLALQMERTINVGDWIEFDRSVGRVKEIRWRHTAIETRNWDTLVIPNSALMKGQVLVLGRREGAPVQHRQWVYFNVDFRIAPTSVIAAINSALQSEPIPGVALTPPAHCILYDFKESYCQYAVRYWLTDLAADDPTNSLVRTRIYFALKRREIPLSIPAQSMFVTKESEARRLLKHERELNRRLDALANIELFHTLHEDERRVLAERLHVAPFTKDEVMIQQGTEGHSLYILIRGSAEVTISTEGEGRITIATLQQGDFFGEMALMTGETRSATVVALEDVECYRLDRQGFHNVLANRPEIAEHISHVLARRRLELEAARNGLDAAASQHSMPTAQRDIIARIFQFFGLGTTHGS